MRFFTMQPKYGINSAKLLVEAENDGIRDLSHVSRIRVQNEKNLATLLQPFFAPSSIRGIN